MRVLAGTSGFSYSEWKGSFYPADLKNQDMLSFYAERLPTVEINNTFYRMPGTTTLQSWKDATPDAFRFVLKAPRRITHQDRLEEIDDSITYFFDQASVLGEKLGLILFQLPPYLRKDVPRLASFLQIVPRHHSIVLEFRSRTWFTEDVFDLLREHRVALCVTDWEDETKQAPVLATAPFGYFRLRRETYGDRELKSWLVRMGNQPWDEVYVFFKHEAEGAAPRYAGRLIELVL